jgi:hypothetical protein
MRVSPAGIGALGAAVLVAVVCVSVHSSHNGSISLMSECVPLPLPARVRAGSICVERVSIAAASLGARVGCRAGQLKC